jgi:signal transduction histidine kinase
VTLHVVRSTVAVISDEVLLESVLRNLVRNAVKYTQPHGRVLVGCRRQGAELRIEVHDTGVGMPRDKLAGLFQAFYRVDPGRPDGLGLGLFVVKRAADLLGHRVEVFSSLGHGSCFAVIAPAAQAGAPIRAA